MVVHQLAAITALALHIVIGRDPVPKTKPVASSEIARVVPAAFAVWFLWFGFNAGKAHGANPVATQVIVNTIAATTTSLLMSFFYDQFFEVVTTPVSMAVAVLIALVAITPAAGFVTVGGAMCTAIFALIVTRLVGHNLVKEGNGVNEPLSILTIHGVGGTAGFFATAVFSYNFINPWAFNGLTWGRGIPLAHHISAILALWSVGFIAVLLLAFIVNAVFPLSLVKSDAEYKTPVGAAPQTAETPEKAPKKVEEDVSSPTDDRVVNESGVELSEV